MWITLRNVLVGIEQDPKMVALARAAVLYLLPLGLDVAAVHLAGWGVASPEFAGLAAATTVLMRAVGESIIDTLKQQKLGIANGKDQA